MPYAGPVRRALIALAVAVLAATVIPAASFGHAERPAFFPDHTRGSVPKYRTGGPSLVVCKPDSRRRIRRLLDGPVERKNLRLLKRCKFEHIQAAVNAASNGTRILVVPGVYREQPSLRAPEPDPRCADSYVPAANDQVGGVDDPSQDTQVPAYEYQRKCPNAQNLIAITGDDDDPDRECDDKCRIQIEGTGSKAKQVRIKGERSKLNVIRADRADGIYLRNFLVEFSDFNNIYALETNGFVFDRIVSRFSREYDFLSFTSDNGLYDRLNAYGAGDSGIYPGSGPEGHCERYGIEIRNSNSHDNTIGYSGTAGNGVYAHNNRFHHNATGMTTDSFASGHPGMPQDCAKWENNQIYSNNLDLFNEERDEYCEIKNRPIAERDPRVVCPTFQVPVGTGALIAGGNGNIVRNNRVWDNWRDGFKLFYVPANFRGEPEKGIDTSFDNRFEGNRMGTRPDGTRDPNGNDFWWDEEGSGNCWTANTGPGGAPPTSNSPLPDCPGSPVFSPGNPDKTASQAPCAAWDPQDEDLQDPPGCDWFTRPPEPE